MRKAYSVMPITAGIALLAAALAARAAPAATAPAAADSRDEEIANLRRQIVGERAALDTQQRSIDAQRVRLQQLETAMLARLGGPASPATASQPGEVPLPPSPPPAVEGTSGGGAAQTVGQAPGEQRQVQVAILSEQGGVITRRGRLTLEGDVEYARADRNEVLFRGVAIPESVLIGAFDINESRQDVVTVAPVARLGLTDRLEINARIPYVHRADTTAVAPVADNGATGGTSTGQSAINGSLGDIDFGVRYQFTDGLGGLPFLIAGVQAVAPTGTNPFTVPRDDLGDPLRAATGAGFWGITPTLTALLPTDPAVLFGTVGYTFNLGRHIGRQIGSAIVDHVTPGGEPQASLGIAIALNPRTSLSLGYAHTVSLGTDTKLRLIDPQTGAISNQQRVRTRDLQLGRLLFGVSYRTSVNTTINWNVEIGATADATDLRTTLRIPLSIDIF